MSRDHENGIRVIAENIVWDDPDVQLPDHTCLLMISCENINGVCVKTSVLAALSEKYHCKVGDCKLYTEIEVPFSEVMYYDEATRITIEENSLYDLFDELPVSVTAKVPLEALQK